MTKRNARWNLCISHKNRRQINKNCWNACVASGVTQLRTVHIPDEIIQQIFVGLPMIGCANQKHIINGAFYTVIELDPIRLQDTETGEIICIETEHTKYLRISFAITYHASQGRTLKESTRLWDTNHTYFTMKHLALGMSRVVDGKLLEIA